MAPSLPVPGLRLGGIIVEMEHELRVSIVSHFWGREIVADSIRIADELVPFLLEHYDIKPRAAAGLGQPQ